MLAGASAEDRRRRDAVVEAVVGVLASVAALLDPAAVVVGGPWAHADGFVDALVARAEGLVVPRMALVPASLGPAAPLLGTRLAATRELRARLFPSLGPRASLSAER